MHVCSMRHTRVVDGRVQSNARIDKSPETGLRGLFANRDIKNGDVVIAVPVNISMDIGPAQWTSAVWHHSPDLYSTFTNDFCAFATHCRVLIIIMLLLYLKHVHEVTGCLHVSPPYCLPDSNPSLPTASPKD